MSLLMCHYCFCTCIRSRLTQQHLYNMMQCSEITLHLTTLNKAYNGQYLLMLYLFVQIYLLLFLYWISLYCAIFWLFCPTSMCCSSVCMCIYICMICCLSIHKWLITLSAAVSSISQVSALRGCQAHLAVTFYSKLFQEKKKRTNRRQTAAQPWLRHLFYHLSSACHCRGPSCILHYHQHSYNQINNAALKACSPLKDLKPPCSISSQTLPTSLQHHARKYLPPLAVMLPPPLIHTSPSS